MFYNFLFYLFERKYLLDEMVYVWILFDIFNFDYFVSFFFFILIIWLCVILVLRMCEMIISCFGYF